MSEFIIGIQGLLWENTAWMFSPALHHSPWFSEWSLHWLIRRNSLSISGDCKERFMMCSLNSVELSQSNVKTCGLITETSFQLIDFYHEKTLLPLPGEGVDKLGKYKLSERCQWHCMHGLFSLQTFDNEIHQSITALIDYITWSKYKLKINSILRHFERVNEPLTSEALEKMKSNLDDLYQYCQVS